MKNLKIYLSLVDGSILPMDFSTGRELIHEMVSDDFGAPPKSLIFEISTKEGKIIKIAIPYSDDDTVSIFSQP